MNSDKKIILIGPMGVGKSTLGKIVAQKLNWRYIDNDVDMATQSGITIAELSALPVPELHKIEAEFIKRVMQQDAPLISGAAASVIENEEIREMLKNVYAVYLSISVEKAIERASTGTVGRQALTGEGTQILRERFARRDPLYRSVASLIIEQSGSPENDSEIILEAITFQ